MGGAKLSPEQTRAQDRLFVSQCSLLGLQTSLPLKWPIPVDMPTSPKKGYRSAYIYAWLPALNDPQQVRNWLRTQLRDRKREVFACLFLDARHRLICYDELFAGSLDSAEVYPRVVVQQALRHHAAAALFVHNHPSGHPEPSSADHAMTARLKQALGLVDIRVLDHFIVADNEITSFAERGWL